jgi:hypothetical protein
MAKRRRTEPKPFRVPVGIAQTERLGDGREYQVQRGIVGQKEYKCPGCRGTIFPGEVQVVVWPSQTQGWAGVGVGARRHWHVGCWERA